MKKSSILLLVGILLLQLLAVCFYAGSLDNDKYSFIGDEYHMYIYALNIIDGSERHNPFSLNGVFGTNPVLGSYYQAGVMLLFGVNIYGWKLSSILLIFPIGLLMFYLVKRIGSLPAAFFALIATDFSFYFYNFFQIGYLNNLSLLFLVVIMYLLSFIDTKKKIIQSYKLYFLLGVVTGFSWYFYIGKLYIFIVSAYLLITNKINRRFVRYFSLFLITAITIIGISFFATPPNKSDLGLSKTLFHKEFSDNSIILNNIFYPFTLHLYTPTKTHYLPRESYVDQVTASLATIGFLLMLLSIFYKRYRVYQGFHKFLLLFVLVAFSIGITSPYALPPVTRGIHYVPFYILVAAYCLLYLTFLLRDKKFLSIFVYAFSTAAVIFLNVAFIKAPIPNNTTKKLFSYLKNEKPSDIYYLSNKRCFNFALLVTMNNGFILPHNAQQVDNIDNKLCKKGTIVVTCGVNVCQKKPTKVLDRFIYIYK